MTKKNLMKSSLHLLEIKDVFSVNDTGHEVARKKKSHSPQNKSNMALMSYHKQKKVEE